MILCRSISIMSQSERSKLALFCNVKPEDVITALNVDNIYKIPLVYHKEGLDNRVLAHFNMSETAKEPDLSKWQEIEHILDSRKDSVEIAIVGKYCGLQDAYKSLNEALLHAGLANKVKVNLSWIESETLEGISESEIADRLKNFKAILIPGGFGSRGVEGKINAITYARKNKVPCLGICLGMQSMAIEAARNVLGIADANSGEFAENCTPIISLMNEWEKDGQKQIRTAKTNKGGTLRLGAYPCRITKGTLADRVYGQDLIYERHRHRYEMDISFEAALNEKGYVISGKSPDGILPEIIELTNHPFFIGVQFHPEFKSRPFAPHALFTAFVKAAMQKD